MFACDHYGVQTDMLLVSKALSGGIVPVGALIVRDEVFAKGYDRQGVFVHRSTYMKNDYAMAAGLASLSLIGENALVEKVARRGKRLVDGLRQLQNKYSMIKDVRGMGLLVGVEFRSPKRLIQRISGILLEKRGLLGHMTMMQLMEGHRVITTPARQRNMLRIHPPYIILDEDVDYFIDAFDSVKKEAHKFPDGISQYVLRKLFRN